MTTSTSAVLTIGIPVYNGERYLEEAIKSVLSQTFSDFNVIISDNASTDGTRQIAEKYQSLDPRVKYVRLEKNMGAAINFNRIVEIADTKYFKWMAHDDVIADTFIQKCIEVLEQNADVVVAYSQAEEIDENGKLLGLKYDVGHTKNFSADLPSRRFYDLVCVNHSCLSVFGVIRSNALKKTKLIEPYVGSDRVLLSDLGLMGKIYEIPEVLFYHREHAGRSTRKIPDLQARIAWFDTSRKKSHTFPNWRLLKEYLKVIFHARIPPKEKIKSTLHIMRWLSYGGWRLLVDDIKYYL